MSFRRIEVKPFLFLREHVFECAKDSSIRICIKWILEYLQGGAQDEEIYLKET